MRNTKTLVLFIIVISLVLSGASVPEKQNTELPKQPDRQSEKGRIQQKLDAESKTKNPADHLNSRDGFVLEDQLAKAPPADNAKKQPHNWLDWFKAVGPDWFLAILAGVAAIIAACTLWANTRSASAAATNAKTLIRQNSPYLGFYDFSLDPDVPGTPSRPQIHYYVRNYNQARALSIEVSGNIQWGSLPKAPAYEIPTAYGPHGMNLGYMEPLKIPVSFGDDIATIQDINDRFARGERLSYTGLLDVLMRFIRDTLSDLAANARTGLLGPQVEQPIITSNPLFAFLN